MYNLDKYKWGSKSFCDAENFLAVLGSVVNVAFTT